MSDRLTLQSLAVHALPLWFLVFSLFLPRIALVIAWFDRDLVRFHLDAIIAPILALLLPRILILVLIYRDQGISLWFLIHLIHLIGAVRVGRNRRTDHGAAWAQARRLLEVAPHNLS